MPVRTAIEVTGVRQIGYAGRKMAEGDAIRIIDGLRLCGELIYQYSQALVPIDSGALRDSARIVVEGRGLLATVTVEYGGRDAPYAWIVHEDMNAYHEPPTQAKYLSAAINMARDECAAILRRQFFSTGTQPQAEGVQ